MKKEVIRIRLITLIAMLALICYALGIGITAVKADGVTIAESDFYVRTIGLRVENEQYTSGVNFKTVMSKAVYDEYVAGGSDVKTGTLVAQTYALEGRTLQVGEEKAKDLDTTGRWQLKEYDENNDGANEQYMESAIYVYDIPKEYYGSNITVVSYVLIDGTAYYSKRPAEISLASAAKSMLDGGFVAAEDENEFKDTYTGFSLKYTSGSSEQTETVYYGDKIAAPENPSAEAGYKFDGWYNRDYTQKWDFENNTVSGNINLFAKFSPNIGRLADSFGGQGDGGFIYLKTNVSYDGGFHVTDCHELTYNGTNQRYEEGDLYVSANGMYISGATLAFRNYSGDTKEFVFNGQATYLGGGSNGAALAYVKMNADGTFTTLSDWHPYSSSAPLSISERITLGAGAAFMLVLRDNSGDDTLTGITLEVGTTSAEMDISKTLLSDYIVSVSGINNDEGIYTEDSYDAFVSAKTSAEGVNVKSDADEGEIYRALTELKAAYKGLAKANPKTSADYTEVIAENSPWKVYQPGIIFNPTKLTDVNDTNLYIYESGELINGTNTVSAGDNALTVKTEGGIAFVFEIEKTGSYTISGTYTGETRGNARIFIQTNGSGDFNEAPDGWLEKQTEFEKTNPANAGDRIAIHFEGPLNAQISFFLTLNP